MEKDQENVDTKPHGTRCQLQISESLGIERNSEFKFEPFRPRSCIEMIAFHSQYYLSLLEGSLHIKSITFVELNILNCPKYSHRQFLIRNFIRRRQRDLSCALRASLSESLGVTTAVSTFKGARSPPVLALELPITDRDLLAHGYYWL